MHVMAYRNFWSMANVRIVHRTLIQVMMGELAFLIRVDHFNVSSKMVHARNVTHSAANRVMQEYALQANATQGQSY